MSRQKPPSYDDIEAVEAERDDWKDRCEAAENRITEVEAIDQRMCLDYSKMVETLAETREQIARLRESLAEFVGYVGQLAYPSADKMLAKARAILKETQP